MNERIENKRSITISTSTPENAVHASSRLLLMGSQTTTQQQQSSSNPEYSNTVKKCRYHRVRQQQQLPSSDSRSQPTATNKRTPEATIGAATNQIPDPLSGTRFSANSKLISERYLVFDTMDGSSFYNCIDICDRTPLQCKVSFYCFFWKCKKLIFL